MVCIMSGILVECLSQDERALCLPCTLHELDERLIDIQIRTSHGWPKASYYRKQQAEFDRELAESRAQARGQSPYE